MNVTEVLWTMLIGYMLHWWKATVVVGMPAHLNSSVANRQEALCDYLDKDDEQKNAYSLGSGYCCFCPPGMYFDGDCDPTNPPSTQCKQCPLGTHMPYGPHLETQCYKKRYGRHCPYPKVYFEGDRKVADGCVCPDGMYEDSGTGECKQKMKVVHAILPTTNEPTERPTIVDAIIRSMQTPSSSPSTEVGTSQVITTKLLQRAVPIKLTSKTTPKINGIKTTMPATEGMVNVEPSLSASTTKVSPMASGGSALWIFLVFAGLVVFAILIVISLLICRIRKEPSKPSDVTYSNSQLNDGSSTAPMIVSDCPADNRSSRAPTSYHHEVGTPLLEHATTQRNSTSNGSSSEHLSEGTFDNRFAIEGDAAKILERDYRKFALKVATKLGQICKRKDVLPIFRSLVGNDHEIVLDDLCRQHHSSTAELIYQCMSQAVIWEGVRLSPLYLLDKIGSLNYESYTEIVSSEIKLFVIDEYET